jgi:hypothetical protein
LRLRIARDAIHPSDAEFKLLAVKRVRRDERLGLVGTSGLVNLYDSALGQNRIQARRSRRRDPKREVLRIGI